VERCRVLVHLVEGASPEPGRSPSADLAAINRELALYSPELARKPQILAITKVDLPAARAAGKELAKALGRRKKPVEVHQVSAVTGEGIDALVDAMGRAVFPAARPQRGGQGRKLAKPRARG
jgi:GTP-binding protein